MEFEINIAPPFPELEEEESVVAPAREILPLVLEKEIAPPFPILIEDEFEVEIKANPESRMLPLELVKEIAPPFLP